jgi:hypothetical protein
MALLAVVLLLAIGCVPHLEISPAAQPAVSTSAKFPASVAVVCSERMKSLVERFSLPLDGRSDGRVDTAYYFEVGEPLCKSLVRSVEAAYARAVEVPVSPQAGAYDRVLDFSLQNSGLILPPGVSSVNAGSIRYTLFVSMAAYDGRTMALVKRAIVEGVGYPTGKRVWSWLREPVASAVEAGLQDLSTNTTKTLSAGFAEPR